MEYTMKQHEEHLNKTGTPAEMSVLSKRRIKEGGYGTWLRRNDPIQFEISYRDALREKNK